MGLNWVLNLIITGIPSILEGRSLDTDTVCEKF